MARQHGERKDVDDKKPRKKEKATEEKKNDKFIPTSKYYER